MQAITVRNSGMPGEQTGQGRARLPGELDAQHWDLVILLEGFNDLFFDPNSAAAAAADLRVMVQTAKSRGVEVILCTLTPVTTNNSKGVPQTAIADLNSRIGSVAAQESVLLVDLHAALNGNGAFLSADGVHPTPSGYDQMASTLFNAIQANFEILTITAR
jgi:lysophospholipase L1-like esterase